MTSLPFGLLSATAALAIAAGGCVNAPNDLRQVSGGLDRRSSGSVTNKPGGEVLWPPQVSLEDGLSEDEAVSIALWNNATFQEVLADLGLSRADLIQAGMLPNPTLSMLIPVGAKPLEVTAKLPFELLWLRPRRVAAARLDYDRTAQRLVQSGLDLIRDTRVAFADYMLAEERGRLAAESLSITRQLAELAAARLRAGDATALEAGQADIDALQAREQLSRAQQDAELARERLRHLLGLGRESFVARFNPSPLPQIPELRVELLLTNALAARPDLRAAEIAVEAAGKRIGLARAEAFTLAAGVNGKDIGSGASKEFLVGPALDFPLPILNQNQGGVAQAKARFEKAARQYFAVRDRLVLEVRESYLRLTQARESFDQWQQRILPSLEDLAQQAGRAYAAGNVSYLLVLEADRKLFDARAKEAGAAADLRRARAELERSVGQRLDVARNAPPSSPHEIN
jgi:cobalt-zinc-cadmium efflux system outer membrane protein